jgi:hypothetical protein
MSAEYVPWHFRLREQFGPQPFSLLRLLSFIFLFSWLS